MNGSERLPLCCLQMNDTALMADRGSHRDVPLVRRLRQHH